MTTIREVSMITNAPSERFPLFTSSGAISSQNLPLQPIGHWQEISPAGLMLQLTLLKHGLGIHLGTHCSDSRRNPGIQLDRKIRQIF